MRLLKNYAKKLVLLVIAIIFWILIWHFYARKVDSSIFLPTPKETLKALLVLVRKKTFWRIVVTSLKRILTGFILAVVSGIVLAAISAFNFVIRILLEPFMKLVKSVPVASFTILILLWIHSEELSVVISFFMVLPVIYINVLQGFENVDCDMIEMAKVYQVSKAKIIRFLYVPAVDPAFFSACRIGIGLCFKSGIAAEVIGLPVRSIGSELYKAKLYLMTDELFAWTIVIICMSVLFENVCIVLLRVISRRIKNVSVKNVRGIIQAPPSGVEAKNQPHQINELDVVEISKFYDHQCVLQDISFQVKGGEVFCVMGESGIGKTTLMKIIMGIVKPDFGHVVFQNENSILTAAFQEDRLLKNADIYTNLYFAMKDDKNFNQKIPLIDCHLKQAGLEGLGRKRVEELSGGMLRRVSIIRAVITNPDILILDEALNGMDQATKELMIAYIKMYCSDKIVIMVTHHIEEAKKMGAKIFRIGE
ncbi:MAG: ATP-binding cassette domain-containing protein [Lachnospiraceae bacterium]|nr:ATP-binding cassette domain-containing protein [Lachnospiraceae bacterium]